MLRTDWKYYIDAYEVSPFGTDKANIRYKHDEGEIFFTQEFDGSLTFTGSDYLIFKADYDLGNYCTRYEFIIEQKCNHEYEVRFMGYFSLFEGEFDLDKCIFKVKPTIEDKYTCIKRVQDVEINLMDLTKYIITLQKVSTYEFSYMTDANFFAVYTNFGTFSGTWYNVLTPGEETFSIPIYGREVIVLEENETPIGAGWASPDEVCINISDEVPCSNYIINYQSVPYGSKKWVRDCSYNVITLTAADLFIHWNTGTYDADTSLKRMLYLFTVNGSIQFINSYFYFKKSYLNSLFANYDTVDYINCIKLTDAINLVKDQCTIGDLQSEFFTNVTNPVTGLASKTNNIYLIQNSDAKRPTASNKATLGKITWKDLSEQISNYFNVKWYLNDTSDLIIEHVSTIAKNAGLDITIAPHIETTANRRKFQFDKERIFKYESWTVGSQKNTDFVGLPIYYADDCTVINGEVNTKNYPVDKIITDIMYALTSPNNVSDEGFTMVACDGSNVIINEAGAITEVTKENGSLSIANLHELYWRHERIFITGNMNGVATTFESALKLRKLDKLSIKQCCDIEFDPVDTINTDLGAANVESASFSLFDYKVELELIA